MEPTHAGHLHHPALARRLDRRLQPPGAAFGAQHAEPGRLPGGDVSERRTHAPICLGNWGADQAGLLPKVPLTARSLV